jgi:hypothetical protein
MYEEATLMDYAAAREVVRLRYELRRLVAERPAGADAAARTILARIETLVAADAEAPSSPAGRSAWRRAELPAHSGVLRCRSAARSCQVEAERQAVAYRLLNSLASYQGRQQRVLPLLTDTFPVIELPAVQPGGVPFPTVQTLIATAPQVLGGNGCPFVQMLRAYSVVTAEHDPVP